MNPGLSRLRVDWLIISLWLTGGALAVLGLGLFNVGLHDPSNEAVYSFNAVAVLNWLAYFGSFR